MIIGIMKTNTHKLVSFGFFSMFYAGFLDALLDGLHADAYLLRYNPSRKLMSEKLALV